MEEPNIFVKYSDFLMSIVCCIRATMHCVLVDRMLCLRHEAQEYDTVYMYLLYTCCRCVLSAVYFSLC